jgi:AraC-like DNA-binding protein
MRHSSIGAMTSPAAWAVEYHSKYAGEVELPNGTRYSRKKESVHLYAPNCEYREITTDADFPIQETYISFSFGSTLNLESLTGKDGIAKFLHAGHIGKLMLKTADACYLRGYDARLAAQSALLAILDPLIHARQHSKNTYIIDTLQQEASFTEEVEQFLRQRLSDKVKNSDIARYMKVSESTLSHKFKAEDGGSPIARLIEFRIDFAKTLLIKGEPLKIIADMTGFGDEFHLSKIFKKVTGESPREFRNEYNIS